MSTWKYLQIGDEVTVRSKRSIADTEDVVVAKLLPRTLIDGTRFETADGRVFTFYLHDLTRRPAKPASSTGASPAPAL